MSSLRPLCSHRSVLQSPMFNLNSYNIFKIRFSVRHCITLESTTIYLNLYGIRKQWHCKICTEIISKLTLKYIFGFGYFFWSHSFNILKVFLSWNQLRYYKVVKCSYLISRKKEKLYLKPEHINVKSGHFPDDGSDVEWNTDQHWTAIMEEWLSTMIKTQADL